MDKCLSTLLDLKLADAYNRKGLDLLKKVKNIKELKESGNGAYRQNNFVDASKFYKEAIKIDPLNQKMNSVLHYNLAASNFYLFNYEESSTNATNALQFDEKYAKALVIRAKCCFQLKKFNDCISDCKVILEIEKTDEIQKLLTDSRHHVFIEDAIAQAKLKFDENDLRNCFSDCAEILGLQEIDVVRSLLNESSKLLIIEVQKIYDLEDDFERCIEDCDRILNYQDCSKAKSLKSKALNQISFHKTLNEIISRLKQNFEKTNFKDCIADSKLFYDKLENVETKNSQYKIQVDNIMEQIYTFMDENNRIADEYFKKAEYDRCIEECKKILNIKDSNKIQTLMKEASLIYNNKIENIYRVKMLYENKQFKECINACNDILKSTDDEEIKVFLNNVRDHIAQAMAEAKNNFQLQRFGECKKCCEFILSVEESDEAKTLLERSELEEVIESKIIILKKLYYEKSFKECTEECQKLLNFKPNLTEVNDILKSIRGIIEHTLKEALLHLNKGNLDKCINECDRILSIEESPDVLNMKTEALTQINKRKENTLNAKRLYNNSEYKKCIEECKAILTMETNSEIIQILKNINSKIASCLEKAQNYFELKQFDVCIENCEYILNVEVNHEAEKLLQLAKLAFVRQLFKAKEFEKCLENCSMFFKNEDSDEVLFLIDCCDTALKEKNTTAMHEGTLNFEILEMEPDLNKGVEFMDVSN